MCNACAFQSYDIRDAVNALFRLLVSLSESLGYKCRIWSYYIKENNSEVAYEDALNELIVEIMKILRQEHPNNDNGDYYNFIANETFVSVKIIEQFADY